MSLLISLLVGAIFILIIFLITRQLTLWYFRVNEIVALLEKIEENTRQGVNKQLISMSKENEVSAELNNGSRIN